MENPGLLIISLIRVLVEVAMLTLLGQGVLALLAGRRRATNPIYRLFQVIVSPAIKTVRHILPQRVSDKHVPFVAFLLLFWLWIFLAYVKRIICEMNRLNCFG